jgi:Domain of unknown function (DUF4347)
MILMDEPSYAFNSVDVPAPTYRMWITENGDAGTSVPDLVRSIAEATRAALEQKQSNILNIVINSHGLDGGGKIFIGGKGRPGLDMSNVQQFSFLRGRGAGTIWLVACQAAAGPLGKQLCQSLAIFSGYQVVASDADQDTGAWGTFRLLAQYFSHQIDEFEGTVYGFTASGNIRAIDPHDDIFTIKE